MQFDRGRVVRRGDTSSLTKTLMSSLYALPIRRRGHFRRVLFASSAVGASVVAFAAHRSHPSTTQLRNELESAKGELNLVRAQVQRANAIIRYSSTYSVAADVAT